MGETTAELAAFYLDDGDAFEQLGETQADEQRDLGLANEPVACGVVWA